MPGPEFHGGRVSFDIDTSEPTERDYDESSQRYATHHMRNMPLEDLRRVVQHKIWGQAMMDYTGWPALGAVIVLALQMLFDPPAGNLAALLIMLLVAIFGPRLWGHPLLPSWVMVSAGAVAAAGIQWIFGTDVSLFLTILVTAIFLIGNSMFNGSTERESYEIYLERARER